MADVRGALQRAAAGLLLAALGLGGCATQPEMRDDALIGRIVDARTARDLTREQLVERMRQADVVYIGETHDNPQQQRIQLELLQALLAAGARPALGSEFFAREETSILYRFLRPGPHAGSGDWRAPLREALGWGAARDGDWQHYEPLLTVVRESGLAVFGAELPDALRRRLSRGSVEDLHPVERQQLPTLGEDDPVYREQMYDAFTASHCGWRDETVLQRLYATWRLRNETMARAVIAATEDPASRPVLLITGAGHVAGNRGIYERVAALRPALKQLNLGLRQVAMQQQPLDHYLAADPAGGAPEHDILWLTQRTSYIDPCERFRQHLKQPPR